MSEKQYLEVLGRRMAYVETGDPGGRPIVFLHGNPTSSYLWRHVTPPVSHLGQCLAPDLIGMGDSEKLPDSGPERYTLAEHQQYLDGFLDAAGVTNGGNVILVIHDWGSALGFDWARRHPDKVAGIAYMEAVVAPLSWDDWPKRSAPLFQALRSPDGEGLVLEQNVFVEQILPGATLGGIGEADMAEFRRPFAEPGESRRPTLSWPRQIPIDGRPPEVVAVVEAYGAWLEQAPVPKLFVNGEPGAILRGAPRDYCRSWPAQSEVTVPGVHFLQEDSGPEIGAALADWITRQSL